MEPTTFSSNNNNNVGCLNIAVNPTEKKQELKFANIFLEKTGWLTPSSHHLTLCQLLHGRIVDLYPLQQKKRITDSLALTAQELLQVVDLLAKDKFNQYSVVTLSMSPSVFSSLPQNEINNIYFLGKLSSVLHLKIGDIMAVPLPSKKKKKVVEQTPIAPVIQVHENSFGVLKTYFLWCLFKLIEQSELIQYNIQQSGIEDKKTRSVPKGRFGSGLDNPNRAVETLAKLMREIRAFEKIVKRNIASLEQLFAALKNRKQSSSPNLQRDLRNAILEIQRNRKYLTFHLKRLRETVKSIQDCLPVAPSALRDTCESSNDTDTSPSAVSNVAALMKAGQGMLDFMMKYPVVSDGSVEVMNQSLNQMKKCIQRYPGLFFTEEQIKEQEALDFEVEMLKHLDPEEVNYLKEVQREAFDKYQEIVQILDGCHDLAEKMLSIYEKDLEQLYPTDEVVKYEESRWLLTIDDHRFSTEEFSKVGRKQKENPVDHNKNDKGIISNTNSNSKEIQALFRESVRTWEWLFSNLEMKKVSSDHFDFLSPYNQWRLITARQEVLDHIFLGNSAAHYLIDALIKGNLKGIATVFPMFVLDLQVQVEKLCESEYLEATGEMHQGHSLVHFIHGGKLANRLTQESRAHLQEIDKGMLWARYPCEYFANALVPSETLHLIKGCIDLLDRLESQSPFFCDEATITFLQKIYDFVIKKHLGGQNLLLQLSSSRIDKDGKLAIQNLMEMQTVEFHKAKKLIQENLIGVLSEPKKPTNASIPVGELRKGMESLKEVLIFLKKEQEGGFDPLTISLEEAYAHLLRHVSAIEILDQCSDPIFAPLLHRNLLNVQTIFEKLYRTQCIACGAFDVSDHNFKHFEQALKDCRDLDATIPVRDTKLHEKIRRFNFASGVHYPHLISKMVHSLPEIKAFVNLTKQTKNISANEDEWITQHSEHKMSWKAASLHLFQESLEPLIGHIQETLSDVQRAFFVQSSK